MKILAFSDLHRDAEAARKIADASADADVLIGAGDFATAGQGAAETIDILRGITVPAVLVSGNHDNSDDLRALCSEWDNAHLLHGEAVTIGGITFFGLGGEIPERNEAPWNEAVSEEDAAQFLAHCPEHAVLVTHAPPFGCADLQKDGTHEGSTAILAAIEEQQPLINLCGHIHAAWGATGKIGKTPVHNLGPVINWFEL